MSSSTVWPQSIKLLDLRQQPKQSFALNEKKKKTKHKKPLCFINQMWMTQILGKSIGRTNSTDI